MDCIRKLCQRIVIIVTRISCFKTWEDVLHDAAGRAVGWGSRGNWKAPSSWGPPCRPGPSVQKSSRRSIECHEPLSGQRFTFLSKDVRVSSDPISPAKAPCIQTSWRSPNPFKRNIIAQAASWAFDENWNGCADIWRQSAGTEISA